MADVCITEFTDPGCPWAFSAEPFRARLAWLYGDDLEWKVRLVGLAASPQDNEAKGLTAAKQAAAFAKIAREHGMPIDSSERSRTAATIPACRAVVAARLHAPEAMRALLRALRVRNFAGELLDEPDTLDGAARDAGIEPSDLRAWMEGDEVARELDDDMARAREPLPAARALDHKLANWSGGRRYTCPSYEVVRLSDGVRIAVPGFQPFAAYDVVLANLMPGLDRRADPESVEEVLAWAGTPLASKEVAVLCDTDVFSAREALGRVARERPVGADGYWSLSDAAI
jgi:predicted DsbA family dithiol-disulfide isomerase